MPVSACGNAEFSPSMGICNAYLPSNRSMLQTAEETVLQYSFIVAFIT
jgi:hypothetical protein